MTDLKQLEGVGPAFEAKLEAAGVKTVEALLKKGGTAKGRAALAEKSGIGGKWIMKWVNRADLFRIKGVGSETSDLLEAAGVDTVSELAQRLPENLYKKLASVNKAKKLVRQLPTQDQVAHWIKQAASLPRAVEY
jgi:predicted flap endonuclease-1-like 5' DNA nuclease